MSKKTCNEAYYLRNKDRIRLYQIEYREKNKEKIKLLSKKYYENNKEAISKKDKLRRKIRIYECIGCKKSIETKSNAKTYQNICRPCLARRNANKANKSAVEARTLRPYEAVYRSFQRTALHQIDITFEEFLSFIEIKNCFYCNKEIEWKIKSESNIKNCGSYLKYNLDRKDPNVHYTLNNCVVCCAKCNRIKSNFFNAEEFLKVVQLIKTIRGEW